MTQADVEEAQALFRKAMDRAGVRFDHYGILCKTENNQNNLGVQPWLALTLAIVHFAREKA